MTSEPEQPAGQAPGAGVGGPLPEVAAIAEILLALADPIRLSIVRSLAEAGDEAERQCGLFELPVTKSTLTHHFRVLREAGFIDARYEGTRKFIRLRRADVDAAYPGLLESILQARRSDPVSV